MATTTLNPLAQFRNTRFGINSLPTWDIAQKLGIHYTGDTNLEHGGMFYDSADWQQYGYCNAVEVSIDGGCVFITAGTINRNDDIKSVLSVCGWTIDDDNGDIVNEHDGEIIAAKGSPSFSLVEIEANHSTWGIDGDVRKACKLTTVYGDKGEHYFVDNGKRIKLSDLTGYIISTYVLPNLTIGE